jgi:hypothetical protein
MCYKALHGVTLSYMALHGHLDPHVSNFDRTRCLAGCEKRWGPGGREVDADA